MAKSKEEDIFVGVENPSAIRREMLEVLRDTIRLLKKNEDIKGQGLKGMKQLQC
jgi:hypothetical protein